MDQAITQMLRALSACGVVLSAGGGQAAITARATSVIQPIPTARTTGEADSAHHLLATAAQATTRIDVRTKRVRTSLLQLPRQPRRLSQSERSLITSVQFTAHPRPACDDDTTSAHLGTTKEIICQQ